ncbi:hypothetical protein UPYG_G00074670 [Umbra pygmaea]|uniref:Transposable element P transposase-like RNase H domain-containing protein n=1 Tax=Umbra pygmaea TaxID=75934 RepID=A0ABD0XCF9_UMBPY
MKIPLPHPHTLLKWLQTVNAEPGLNTLLLDMLQRLKNEDPVMYARVCLVLDGMSIRRQVQYDSHKQTMIGFVDLGSGIDETSVASEALVFMVVGLQGPQVDGTTIQLLLTSRVISGSIMVRCGIAPGKTGNVQAQDDTMCLSAVDMSSVVPAEGR